MSDENIFANHNFIKNGDFVLDLADWEINDERKVTHQTGRWNDQTVPFMSAVNEGEGEQTIDLPEHPRPMPKKAEYKLLFHAQANGVTGGKMRINPSMGPEAEMPITPSRKADMKTASDDNEVLLDIDLVPYDFCLDLNTEEKRVKFTLSSPKNDNAGDIRGLRLAFVRVELFLEPLQLCGLSVDGEPQALEDKLHLCVAATHELHLQPAQDNIWTGLEAGLLVGDGVVDPANLLTVNPQWGEEQLIETPWQIACALVQGDEEIQYTLKVRSKYTAELYPLPTVCGHFHLDVVVLQEAAYYPVIDLHQSVPLRVRVESHYTNEALANREVTWTLKDPSGADDIELCRHATDEKGEAEFIWTPVKAGDWKIEASVDSYYKKDEARVLFAMRALQEDPWLTANFSLDDAKREWIWSTKTAYPCRGAMHNVELAFADGHALAETTQKLHWTSEDTADELGMVFVPKLEAENPVSGRSAKWQMKCGNLRNSQFKFRVECSKLLEPSPLQVLELAHNSLEIGDTGQPSRFPSVGDADVPLQVQILSTVEGVGAVPGADVIWKLAGKDDETLPTGADGMSQYAFTPEVEGSFKVFAEIYCPYDEKTDKHEFKLEVLPENPLATMTTVKLDNRELGATGLICFRNAEAVMLCVIPKNDDLEGEWFYLDVTSEVDLGFHFEPPMDERRQMPIEGLSWEVSASSDVSARFQLTLHHAEIEPYVMEGRLLSQTLEDEGTFTFDETKLSDAGTAFPCRGGVHVLRFEPNPGSLLTGLAVAAKWTDEPDPALNVILKPVSDRDLTSAGLEWTLDASKSNGDGAFAPALELSQADFKFPAVPMQLGHNRVEITEYRHPTADPFVGETVDMQIRNQSYYTKETLTELEVSFFDGDTSTSVSTSDTGWAAFNFTATQAGPVRVVATVPSPYDGPDNIPSHKFEFKVLGQLSSSTTLTDEKSLTPIQQKPVNNDAEFSEVREPPFDPVVGQPVWIEIRVLSSGTQRAASGVEVTFFAEQESTRVTTDDQGWARFAYTAEKVGDIEVHAVLESVVNEAGVAPSRTFRFKSLATGGWDDAMIQMNSDSPEVWGKEISFPRISQPHTIKLSVSNPDSPLIGRAICLGLESYSSLSELGITRVVPALGESRPLTASGLSWELTGKIGGAYALVLEAYRLLMRSPANQMSLGPVPTAELADG
ncbi:hypothetical protein [Pseudomonas mandelii]|uniref:hypothetical protein n=1 Tax=Pseudomonas mandelii TaxID=75612 RepID=UPI0020A05690|nr:hypothetical protein [Pseudomonas mandelii]MCO8312358.1 hypothetical protein [Pseudomonas mandelii]